MGAAPGWVPLSFCNRFPTGTSGVRLRRSGAVFVDVPEAQHIPDPGRTSVIKAIFALVVIGIPEGAEEPDVNGEF